MWKERKESLNYTYIVKTSFSSLEANLFTFVKRIDDKNTKCRS